MCVVVTGIGELTTHDDELGTLSDAAVVAEDGVVTWVGPARRAPAADRRPANQPPEAAPPPALPPE